MKFGTGGWRAIIGDEFNRANIRLLAQGLSNRMHREGVVDRGLVISYDRRFLSDVAAWWAIEVLVANEIPVTLIGRPVPTPMGMWTVRNKGCAYGLAVTASHNPALYNGFKLFTEGGRDAELAVTDELADECNSLTEADVRSLEPDAAKASELVTVQMSINWYLDAIMDSLNMDVIRHAHLHVVLDPMFGVAQTALQTVLVTARCEVDVINDRHDPLFGGRMPSPAAGSLDSLRRAVVESGAADECNSLTEADVRSLEPDAAKASELVTVQMSINWYLDAIMDSLNMDVIRHAHLHVVLDPMFGVAQTALQTVLVTARCEVDVINDRHDPLFGGRMPSPAAGSLDSLRRAVVESGAALGIASDGDADRLGIIDDKGNYLTPNQVLVLLYEYLVTEKGWKGPAVRNMSTTHLLDRVAEAHGQRCYEVPVGFKWISAKMAETDAIIGGESSGGLTVRGHIPGKDGIHAGSLLVEAVAASGKKLSEMVEDLVERYGELAMVEAAYDFTPARKEALHRRIFTEHDLPTFNHDVDHISWSDGCKVYFANGGWTTIRFSGTEPVLRVFAEMPTRDEAEAVAHTVAQHLELA